MGKIIGVLNQKGGVGKSILTTQLATSMHVFANKERVNDFVAIYDADYPQHTIKMYRNTENKILKQKIKENNLYYNNKYNSIYDESFNHYPVYSGKLNDIYDNSHFENYLNLKDIKPEEFKLDIDEYIKELKDNNILVRSTFEKFRKTYGYTFIDTTGSVNVDGYDQLFLSNFDHIIIPTKISLNEFKSTMSFVKNIIHPLAKSGKIKYHVMLNCIKAAKKDQAMDILNSLKENNIPVLDTIIYDRDKYINLYLQPGSSGTLSTYFPKADRNIIKLMDEVLNKINN